MYDTEIRRSDLHWCVRIRDGQRFDDVQCPEWAQSLARDINPGARVRLGQLHGQQSVVEVVTIQRHSVSGQQEAETVARRIAEAIEE